MAAGDPLRKLSADLKGESKRVGARGALVVRKTAAAITRDARLMAPVDTGNLRASIGYETRELTASVEAEIGPTASYAAFVEFGTSRMAPHAYMGPALDRNGHLFEKAMADVVTKASRL